MQRIVILGGGVGGTLAANLLARRLRQRIDRGDASAEVTERAPRGQARARVH